VTVLNSFAFRPSKQIDPDLLSLNQYRIAMIAEMIHTASLVHDDVIDKADTRRGKPTVNARWGNRQVSFAIYLTMVNNLKFIKGQKLQVLSNAYVPTYWILLLYIRKF
jgi:hypothetical protein